MKTIIDIIGWIGGLEVLLAYFLVSSQKIKGTGLVYQYLNLTGAIFLIINTVYLSAYPSAFVNVIWVGIAGYSIYKYFRTKKST
ncbi:MAG TPA: hypothetical protein VIK89_11710 [Cytophagaceae bacterium]